MKNLKKHLTLSALFAAGTILSYTAHAEDISNGSDLAAIIAAAGERTGTLTTDITATANLGDLVGTQLTIDGGESTNYGISGTYETYSHYEGITVYEGQKLIINNVGSVDANGNIEKSWNGFARSASAYADADANAYGGAIYNYGKLTIKGSSFSNNYASAFAYASDANANANGGAICNSGVLTITDSSFSNNSASASGTSDARGGAICNSGELTITDSSFSNNSAFADARAEAYARGGAIYNQEGDVNIIASTKDSVFSGNKTIVYGAETNNDIYNNLGTINLYAANGRTISFGGGIVSEGNVGYHSVNINVNGEGTTYDVDGTVLFKTGSINSDNNFELGAGTLKIEDGVSWTDNSLKQTGGTLDLANRVIEETNFTTLNSTGGTVDIDIDLAMGTADQINVTGTLTKAAEIGNINFITTNIADTTKSIAIGNGLHLTGTKDIVSETTLANNYIKVWLAQSETISNSLDVVRFQSINAAISDSSTTTREISLIQNVSATANLGRLAGTQLTIDGGENTRFGISGTYETYSHYEGITVGSEQKLIINNVGSVDETTGTILNSWNGFVRVPSDAYAYGGAIYNESGGTVEITDSSFSNNSAYADANAYGGAIYNYGKLTIKGSSFYNNYASADAYASDANANAYGGAIYNYGKLTIKGSSFYNNYASADAYASDANANANAYGGAICNSGVLTITDSSFSNNSASADAYASGTSDARGGAIYNVGTATITGSSFYNNYAAAYSGNADARGGAIYNQEGDVNIIASTKDSVFSGNYTIVNREITNNDIYNSNGTINLYAANGRTISFGGGIVSEGNVGYHSVNINVNGEGTTYDVDGTVLFKTGSINSDNNFELGAGTLKIEDGVSWTNNTLAMNGGTLDIRSSAESEIGTLNYNGGSLTLNEGANINIDISGTGHDKIIFSNNAQFILNGGKITVDLDDNIVVGSSFKVLEKFTWNGTETEFSDLVKLNNNPSNWSEAYSLIARISSDGSSHSLFIEVIPEPSMFGLFAGLATLALVGTRRRRK